MFGLALFAILAAATVPPLTTALNRSRAHGAARFVVSRMVLARYQAVSRGAVTALRVTRVGSDTVLATFVDGNRNGVLAADIAAGIDTPQGRATSLTGEFPGVVVAPLDQDGAAFSFSPLGTSSSGTLYLSGRDGTRFAVRVVGATGRARVLRYVAATDSWADAQ
ncbi:MAG TPA: GspH/FimT family pseudopilin [Vicinamibacterales bacterium]